MEFIKPYFEILEPVNSIKSIEYAARNCYATQGEISEDNSSAIKMVKQLKNNRHLAMFEFGHDIMFVCSTFEVEELNDFLYTHGSHLYKFLNIVKYNSTYFISFNPRTFLELLDFLDYEDCPVFIKKINTCSKPWEENFEESMVDIEDEVKEYFSETDFYEVFKYVTVRLVTTRSTLAQITRHRENTSFAVQSMRFIDYSKNNLRMIIPEWINRDNFTLSEKEETNFLFNKNYNSTPEEDWIRACIQSEDNYKKARKGKEGSKKQQARDRLLSCSETVILIKTNIRQWKRIFHLRNKPDADPEIRRLMLPLEEEFKKRNFI